MNSKNREILTQTMEDIGGLELRFTTADYANALFDTYERTIDDVCRHVKTASRVLEIGCFNCVVSTTLKRIGYEVAVADVPLIAEDPVLVSFLKREEIPMTSIDLKNTPLPYDDSAFGAVICCEVVEHLPFNPIPVFNEFSRLLSSDGIAYIATPNLTSMTHRLWTLRGKSFHNPIEHYVWQLDPESSMSVGLHWKEYTKKELNEFLEHSGFAVREHYYCRYLNHTDSNFLRRTLVSSIYRIFPYLMQCQVGIYTKR